MNYWWDELAIAFSASSQNLADTDSICRSLSLSTNSQFGDVTSNLPMQIFGRIDASLKEEYKSPLGLAQFLASQLQPVLPRHWDAQVSADAPGFINIRFGTTYLEAFAKDLIENQEALLNTLLPSEVWLVEHTSPNPNKAMHIGHLRNNLLAMTLVRLWEQAGRTIHTEAIDNNRGISIARLMLGFLKFARKDEKQDASVEDWIVEPENWHTPDSMGLAPDKFVDKYYVLGAQACENDPAIDQFARDLVVQWEAKNEYVWKLWQHVLDYSYQGQNLTLARLNNRWDHVWHEHEHYEKGKEYVRRGLEAGVFQQTEEGTILTNLEALGLSDTVVEKSDGTSLYITQDLALTALKVQKWHADHYIWVIGPEQSLAMQQMFAVCSQLSEKNLLDGLSIDKSQCEHLAYGTMRLKDGGKMSSRSGNVVYIDDLFDAARDLARAALSERVTSELSAREIDEIAESIGQAAIRFAILRVGRNTTVNFDMHEAIKFDGDTGPYLQYTAVRANNVIAKAGQLSQHQNLDWSEVSDCELSVWRQLPRIIDYWKQAAEMREPSMLAAYLLQLAQAFNEFYQQERIGDAGESEKARRLVLTKAVVTALQIGLSAFGISVPTRM